MHPVWVVQTHCVTCMETERGSALSEGGPSNCGHTWNTVCCQQTRKKLGAWCWKAVVMRLFRECCIYYEPLTDPRDVYNYMCCGTREVASLIAIGSAHWMLCRALCFQGMWLCPSPLLLYRRACVPMCTIFITVAWCVQVSRGHSDHCLHPYMWEAHSIGWELMCCNYHWHLLVAIIMWSSLCGLSN